MQLYRNCVFSRELLRQEFLKKVIAKESIFSETEYNIDCR